MKSAAKTIELPDRLIGIEPEDWNKIGDVERQFLIDAHDGHFRYLLSEGEVCAWAAPKTANLFSMEVVEQPDFGVIGESLYTLRS